MNIQSMQTTPMMSPAFGMHCGGGQNQLPPQLQQALQSAMKELLQATSMLLKQLQSVLQNEGGMGAQGGQQMPGMSPFGGQGMSPFGGQGMPGMSPFGAPTMPGMGGPFGMPQQGPGLSPAMLNPGKPAAPSGPPQSGVPGAPNTPPKATDKPTNPNLSVKDYLDANNGVLGKLGNQEGVKDKLKARYGDWDDPNRSEADRKQSAYNASRHVGMIKHKDCSDGTPRKENLIGNGKMDGATKGGQIRPGTEMAALKDSLKGEPNSPEQNANTDRILNDPNLAFTKDKHVRKDGTTKSDFKAAMSVIGDKLFFIPGLSNVLKGIGDSKGGLFGAVKGAFGGVTHTWKNDAKGVADAITTGRVNPATLLTSMYAANIEGNEQSPEWAKFGAGFM